MVQPDIIYYDVAAVVITAVCLLSVVVRKLFFGPVNRVYLSVVVLHMLTSVACLGGELYDQYLGALYPLAVRSALTLSYYALRSFAAPAYLMLIAAVSDTSHLLNGKSLLRIAMLWVPMVAAELLILTNPFHHLVYYYVGATSVRGAGIGVLYAIAAYYSLMGVGWLLRWRQVMENDERSSLMVAYLLVLLSVVIQYYDPHMRVEMFISAIVLMLVSAFVVRPEWQLDSQMNTMSLHAYKEKCRRVFLTNKPLLLVYLEIVNMKRLHELVGKEVLQDIVRAVSSNLASRLERGDTLYYLRDGLFCISSKSNDMDHALRIATQAHEEGKARSVAKNERMALTGMRSCVVRVPEDVSDVEGLRIFVRRFGHLVPQSTVTTYAELSRHKDFELQMALSDVVERAIETRSFEVYYQPIRCVKDGRFHSAEALMRLNDPTFGWLPPSVLVAEAEQSGAIVRIGIIMFEKICEFLGKLDFDATGLSYMEINLSTEQCVMPGFSDRLIGIMRANGLDSSRINLEITESSASWSQRIVEDNMRILSDSGMAFSLDDYGTGYSNVMRALKLPFSLVKFDKSLVDDMDDPACSAVLEGSISIMHAAGKQVLVEGVETEEQAQRVSAMGADYIQGYVYSRPLPEDEFVAFLLEHNA